jgi:hypothetical protein
MACNALRQWLNVAVDAEKKKSLDSFHEQVLKDIPVGASKSETRLFRLLPDEDNAPLAGQLVWANLDCQPEFEALSYTWGRSPERTHITLNTIPGFPITLNLAAALRRLRLRDRPRQLWIDDSEAGKRTLACLRLPLDWQSAGRRVYAYIGNGIVSLETKPRGLSFSPLRRALLG